jgi:hypothetical protein
MPSSSDFSTREATPLVRPLKRKETNASANFYVLVRSLNMELIPLPSIQSNVLVQFMSISRRDAAVRRARRISEGSGIAGSTPWLRIYLLGLPHTGESAMSDR